MRNSFGGFLIAVAIGTGLFGPVARATTLAPPMLDITHQCEATAKHNATAMSECVVAESEARADLLQHWDKLPDDNVVKCIKFGRKAKRQPYTAMEKCLAPDIAAASAPAPAGEAKK